MSIYYVVGMYVFYFTCDITFIRTEIFNFKSGFY